LWIGAVALLLVSVASDVFAADAAPWALWDGKETVEQYARRVDLSATKTLDLGGGVTLDLVLIPAGKFVMGTPEPKPVDEAAFQKQILTGQIVFGIGAGILVLLIGGMIVRAIRQRRKPQYSLAAFLVMIIFAGVSLLGGMHWLHSARALAVAEAEYKAALARFQNSYETEKPAHEVTLTKPFYMDKYGVTQAQYQQVTGTNPSHFKGANLPVEMVSWDDALAFCKKVSEKTGLIVRLPMDAEREFACRAGTSTTYYTGDSEADLDKAAWYRANSKNTTHPVGQKEPNVFGLHDMHGNVWEWCADWYEPYKAGAVVDPQGPPEGQVRVLRGGSWGNDPEDCRSAYRNGSYPVRRIIVIGFRVVVGISHQ
jgi:formylglycine-generating enzyme required for sulfatase activity